MAIYRENVLSVQGGQNKTRQVYMYLKNEVHPLKKKKSNLGQQHGPITIYLAGDMRFNQEV